MITLKPDVIQPLSIILHRTVIRPVLFLKKKGYYTGRSIIYLKNILITLSKAVFTNSLLKKDC